MKKTCLFLFSVLISITLISCNNSVIEPCEINNANDEISLEKTYADLQGDVLLLNSNLSHQETRGFLSRLFKRVFNVFVSDCIGAVKGLVNGDNIWESAQGASLNSAKKQSFITAVDATNTFILNAPKRIAGKDETPVTSFLQPKSVALNDLVLVSDPSLATINDSIGYYHNSVIYSTLEGNDNINYWKNVSDEACVLKLNEEIINTIPTNIYSGNDVSNETIEFCSFISDESVACNDYKELINVTKSKYPEIEKHLNVISLYFDGMELVTTDEEWEQYCKDLIELISHSGLPECDKESLKAGVTVGYASSKLWKCEE